MPGPQRDARRGGTSPSRSSPHRPPRPRSLTGREAAGYAAGHVREFTGRDPEAVVGLERTEDGWRVGVEVLETRRVPDSADVLAVYRVEVDHDGELLGYHRDRRYYRGRGEEGQA